MARQAWASSRPPPSTAQRSCRRKSSPTVPLPQSRGGLAWIGLAAAGLIVVALLAVGPLGLLGASPGADPPRRAHHPARVAQPSASIASPVAVGGPSPSPAATAPSAPSPDRPARRRPDRPGHQLPGDTDLDGPDRGQGGPGRDQQPLQGGRARLGRGRRDPGGPRRRPAGRRLAAHPGRRRGGARGGPHQERQAARVPARRRGRARGPRARLGRRGVVRGRPGQGPRRLAADRATAGRRRRHRLRPGDDLDAVRRRRHHARPRRVRDPARQGQGRRLPVRRRDGRHHRPLQGLLAARLGPAVHQADRQRRRVPRPDQGRRHRHRQLREPGPERPEVAHQGHRLLGRSDAHRRARATPASTTSRWPTTTSATPARAACSRPSRTSRSAASRCRAPARTSRRRAPPAVLEAAGTKVAILGYDAIAGGYHATATKVGSAPLSAALVKQDVAAARKAGADVVIVFPHWGTEYDPTPFVNQTAAWRA